MQLSTYHERPNTSLNPSKPPTTIHEGIVGTVRTVNVGVTEIYTVYVTASIWTGIRTFVKDGDEDESDGREYLGPAEFRVGRHEPHSTRIEIDGTGKVDAYVHDVLVERNLFSRLRIRIFVDMSLWEASRSVAAVFHFVFFISWM